MGARIVIIGGGTGGTLVANRLRRKLADDARIVVVDRDDSHVYQPGMLFVPFSMADAEGIVRPRSAQLHDGIELRFAEVDAVDVAASRVHLGGGESLDYDVLVVASGARLATEETEGLESWDGGVHTFYSLDGSRRLREAFDAFDGGRLVVDVVDMPIKCPVAPLEFLFLADWRLRQRGIRERCELTLITPLDGAFTKPLAAERLGSLLEGRQISVESEFATGRVDRDAQSVESFDGRTVPFDLLVAIPVHAGAKYVARSEGLGDAMGFVLADRNTLQAKAAPNIFAIGDAADVPTSKAGSVTHFEGETVTANILAFLAGEPLAGSFEGHTNCFIETGFSRALLIDFDYEHEPAPGRYPERHIGPLPLLGESRLNHLAKLAFEPIYWHVLLAGHDIPGIGGGSSVAASGR